MRCQRCNQNEATTHIRQNINGHVTEMYLSLLLLTWFSLVLHLLKEQI